MRCPWLGGMSRGERSAPERRGDAAARRPYRRAECEISGLAIVAYAKKTSSNFNYRMAKGQHLPLGYAPLNPELRPMIPELT